MESFGTTKRGAARTQLSTAHWNAKERLVGEKDALGLRTPYFGYEGEAEEDAAMGR